MSSRGRGHVLVALLVLALSVAGCARVPAHRYGVKSLTVEGVEALDQDALEACLITRERSRASIDLGVHPEPVCGEPPFDAWRYHLPLWTWGFSDWPLYDRLSFERDKQRIERWYRARGFHHARVVASAVQPAQAQTSDVIDPKHPRPGCKRVARGQGCTVRVRFWVHEGEPTRIGELELTGVAHLSSKIREALEGGLALRSGQRFDEATYDLAKAKLTETLQEHGYALARVGGHVRIDRAAHRAHVRLEVESGPKCVFGRVIVVGAPAYMVTMIRETALIDPGDPYRLETLKSAQRAVFSAGGFSSAAAEPILPEQGNVVDVRLRVQLTRKRRYGFGVGIQSGIVRRGDTWDPISVPQWDVHLLFRYTQERLFAGPRRLTFEGRPALIIQEPFPQASEPRFGNELRLELRQFGGLEPRTAMVASSAHVWGPDPYDTFFRHRLDTGIALERLFLRGERLYVSVGIRNSLYRVPSGEETSEGEAPPANSVVTYLFQRVRLDYRDDATRPRKGFMVQVEGQEFGLAKLSSWSGFRATPDARVYIPLPWYASLAFRFAVGMLFILDADPKLDDLSERLGPRDARLRGGGATSNRGFLPGQLGDGPDGGTRRWEASAELRLRLTPHFGVVGFFDAGDVSKVTRFRWNYPQASSGFGLRYQTIVGAIRLDFAWRIQSMQIYGPDERDPGGEQSKIDFGFAKMAGAIHITLGESF